MFSSLRTGFYGFSTAFYGVPRNRHQKRSKVSTKWLLGLPDGMCVEDFMTLIRQNPTSFVDIVTLDSFCTVKLRIGWRDMILPLSWNVETFAPPKISKHIHQRRITEAYLAFWECQVGLQGWWQGIRQGRLSTGRGHHVVVHVHHLPAKLNRILPYLGSVTIPSQIVKETNPAWIWKEYIFTHTKAYIYIIRSLQTLREGYWDNINMIATKLDARKDYIQFWSGMEMWFGWIRRLIKEMLQNRFISIYRWVFSNHISPQNHVYGDNTDLEVVNTPNRK
jgi:hypothetical protein